MSPCASASAISTVVTAGRSATAPPSSSGTPTMVSPSSFACSSSSFGVAHASSACGAELGEREVADRLTQHLLLVVGRQVEQIAAPRARLTGWLGQLLGRRERSAGAGGGADRRLRGGVEDALRRIPQ